MAATPETLRTEVSETPQIREVVDEFPETIQQIQGAKVIQKTFKAQVNDDKGMPIIQTPPTQVITTIQPPADIETLTKQAKGDTASGSTWLAKLWLRIIQKALHFGWKILSG
jgi:hypothetical protein